MNRLANIWHLLGILIVFGPNTFSQESFYDAATKKLLDSLDQRIIVLENLIPRLAEKRAANYFFVKRDLDFTIFLKHYHMYIFDEDLDRADDLVESRIKAVQKRGDRVALDFYKMYRKKINDEISDQQRRYQALFEKEKNFKKEFYLFVNEGNEYSLKRAQRMTDLALKYALEKKLTSVYGYLHYYKSYIYSLLYDYYSDFDLAKLTQSESAFQKCFKPLVLSDSLDRIQMAGELVDHCYNYVINTTSRLDTVYFANQKNVVASSISDYYARKGNSEVFSAGRETSLIARLDTLVEEGIYKWEENIIVVGNFRPEAVNRNVRKGEAIINADKKLIEYLRINRFTKYGKEVRLGRTYLIPYGYDEQLAEFMYNPDKRSFQYIVCYTRVENELFTKRISQYLPPLQFSSVNGSL